MTRKQKTSILLLIVSIIYDVIPADLIPDIPFIGWLDDILVTSSASVNCLQQFYPEAGDLARKIMTWLKWASFLFAVLIILVVALLAGTIINLLK